MVGFSDSGIDACAGGSAISRITVSYTDAFHSAGPSSWSGESSPPQPASASATTVTSSAAAPDVLLPDGMRLRLRQRSAQIRVPYDGGDRPGGRGGQRIEHRTEPGGSAALAGRA